MDDTRYQRGLTQIEAVSTTHGAEVVQSLEDIAPDFARYIVEFAYGDIFARPGLDMKTRELATVAALTAMGTRRRCALTRRVALGPSQCHSAAPCL